ncbi:MAG: bifunctional folylpolyglutamate synthase/dihydrofolate synthase [Chloroflexi bacterium]|nr:bifunctional folylpolyglutamate synthase/dihydrofolate synthase [Chloroflexota bacterium]
MTLTYTEAVQWYYSFARFDPHPPRTQEPYKLARMEQILARLDNPHTKFPAVHIAGTKGKGSTAALLESMFRTGGYRTGLYTSPHLHSFRERVRINNAPIPKDDLIACTKKLCALATEFPNATYFEWVTALAFLYFAECNIEMAIVEVGLGGRLDSTNVLTPRVSVITPISYDHTDVLGSTLLKIAREKAGIIKPNVPVVIAPQELPILGEVQRKANKLHARIINVEKDWRWQLVETTPERQTVRIRFFKNARWQTFTLPLVGPHQRINLTTALATMDVLHGRNWRISLGSLQQGVAAVDWPGRFEILAYLQAESDTPDPHAPQGYLVADGAHNAASAAQVVRTLDEVFPGATVHFIFAASTDKDIAGMLQAIAPRAASLTLTQAQSRRAASLDTLVCLAAPYARETRTAPNIAEAIDLTLEHIAPGDMVCVTGSLFIVAEARAHFFDIPNDG